MLQQVGFDQVFEGLFAGGFHILVSIDVSPKVARQAQAVTEIMEWRPSLSSVWPLRLLKRSDDVLERQTRSFAGPPQQLGFDRYAHGGLNLPCRVRRSRFRRGAVHQALPAITS